MHLGQEVWPRCSGSEVSHAPGERRLRRAPRWEGAEQLSASRALERSWRLGCPEGHLENFRCHQCWRADPWEQGFAL